MINSYVFSVHFSSLQTWHTGVIESRNPKLIEQEGIFISIHHDKLTDLQTTKKQTKNKTKQKIKLNYRGSSPSVQYRHQILINCDTELIFSINANELCFYVDCYQRAFNDIFIHYI